MRHNLCVTKRFISTLLLAVVSLGMLSACSPNKTEVSNWWYDQQWESAGVSGQTDQ